MKGRKLSAEAVNMDFVTKGNYPPYQFGSMVEDIEIGVGERLYCIEYLNLTQMGKRDAPGAWMGRQLFSSEQEAREAFSILPEFKEVGQPLVIREYIVKKPLQARLGIASSLQSPTNGHQYAGGGPQIELLNQVNYEPAWVDYFQHQGFTDKTETIRNYVKKLN
ncbi:hypothetical protein [Larkinella soli]|uniref:hypothetical protein n=1 Tax=Larkinella soli TaxID=1770527 RepID=UPI000FFB225E|nr:hypothetical protein [Larkinella soli]